MGKHYQRHNAMIKVYPGIDVVARLQRSWNLDSKDPRAQHSKGLHARHYDQSRAHDGQLPAEEQGAAGHEFTIAVSREWSG